MILLRPPFVASGLLWGAGMLAGVIGLSGCGKAVDSPASAARLTAATAAASSASGGASSAPDAGGIAWLHASSSAEIDAAFALARLEAKPVFVYWGAAWCPPCNQLKATLFNRHDFIARSRSFLPVYVDGDSPGAQKLGARFKVSGYPTMVLFDRLGAEVTRLPGEVDASRYLSVLTLAMNATRPVAQVLAQARAGGARLTPDDWRLLAFYSWESDEQRLVPKGGLPALLRQLAAACPAALLDTSQRLELQALAAAGSESPGASIRPDAAALQMLLRLLADEGAARVQMDLLANSAVEITRALTAQGTAARRQVLAAFDSALSRMEVDPQLSRADRLAALGSRVELARIDEQPPAAGAAPRPVDRHLVDRRPALPPALVTDIRETAARVDREITDGYERQAVVTAAADTLDRAGLGAESDTLLRANLVRSHSPYYLMSALARHARARGDRDEALRWYQAAFDRSEGPATRLQWGASYLGALIELDPQDEARIEAAAAQVLREAGAAPDAFDGRSARSLERIGTKLQTWNKAGGSGRRAVLHRLQLQLDGICAALAAADTGRTTCRGLLQPGGPPPKRPPVA